MKDAFAQKIEKLQPCDPQATSFFELIESIWEGQNNNRFIAFAH